MKSHPHLLAVVATLLSGVNGFLFSHSQTQKSHSSSLLQFHQSKQKDQAFLMLSLTQRYTTRLANKTIPKSSIISSTTTALFDQKPDEFSRDLMLREEAEAPFRKVRFFLYAGLGAGAVVSLLVSVTRIAAALSGINSDLLPESCTNAAVDAGGLVVLAWLWQNDLKSQQSRLKRASKGAELAKLKVRVSKSLLYQDEVTDTSGTTASVSVSSKKTDSSSFTTSLASLRRGRGIEKRVIIAAAGREKIASVLSEAKELADALTMNDLLVVPVVVPSIYLPTDMQIDINNNLPDCVAMPVGNSWSVMIEDEVKQAIEQGIDAEKEGICVILKKNGRVGQRTRGVFLANMVGEVSRRRSAGMDVLNI